MSTHSVGLTKKVHRDIQRVKRDYGITMGGFATFALKSILKSDTQIKKIIDKIEENELQTHGAGRLDALGY